MGLVFTSNSVRRQTCAIQRLEELAQAQCRTEEAQRQIEAAQRRTEERFGQLIATVEQLAQEVRTLRLAQQQTDDQIRNSVQADKHVADRLSELRGQMLEIKYRDRAGAYFGRLLRRPQVVSSNVLWDEVEPISRGMTFRMCCSLI